MVTRWKLVIVIHKGEQTVEVELFACGRLFEMSVSLLSLFFGERDCRL